ncbi:MAG: hypothetical protein ACE5EX_05585 [Phycisphaerae bacterium]
MTAEKLRPSACVVAYAVIAPAALGLVAGCRLAGTWQLTDFSPPPRQRHLETISFTIDGRYTATRTAADSDAETSTGRYAWNGFVLTLTGDEDGTVEWSYPCRLFWNLRGLHIGSPASDDPWKAALRRSD